MDPQFATALIAMQAQLKGLTKTVNYAQERLDRVEMHLENRNDMKKNVIRQYHTRGKMRKTLMTNS